MTKTPQKKTAKTTRKKIPSSDDVTTLLTKTLCSLIDAASWAAIEPREGDAMGEACQREGREEVRAIVASLPPELWLALKDEQKAVESRRSASIHRDLVREFAEEVRDMCAAPFDPSEVRNGLPLLAKGIREIDISPVVNKYSSKFLTVV